MSITKHPEYQAFIAAVLAAPDDDLPRLQFSDWLDERGDPRGEFIKVQIELEQYQDERRALTNLANKPWSNGIPPYELDQLRFRGRTITDKIYRRLQEASRLMTLERKSFDECLLKDKYPDAQIDLFTKPVHNAIVAGTFLPNHISWFRRGFIHNIRCTFNEWVANAESILSQNPLKEVTLTTYPEIEFRERDDDELRIRVVYATTILPERNYVTSGAVSLQSLHEHRTFDPIALARERLTQELRSGILSQWPNLKIKYDVPERVTLPNTRWMTAASTIAPGQLVRLAGGYATVATTAGPPRLGSDALRQQLLRTQDGTPYAFEYQQHHVSEEQMLADARAYHSQTDADAMNSPMMQFDNLPPIPNPHFQHIDDFLIDIPENQPDPND